MSNVVSTGTLATDAVAPAQIDTLAAPNVKPNYAVLTWTAVADDGSDPASGLATSYDLRYSTDPIVDDATFNAATQVTNVPTPAVAGSAETVTVHGLTASTTYYFAIKAGDEVPNFSTLSNVITFATLAEDLSAPDTITDLCAPVSQIKSVYLTWTAPADVGTAGLAGYDIRYSTDFIDDGNWDTATQATGEPTPSAPGTPESFTVTGLEPSTTYFFAIRSYDAAEPANVSAISDLTAITTRPPHRSGQRSQPLDRQRPRGRHA